MDKVEILCGKDRDMMYEFSNRAIERIARRSLFLLPLPFFHDYMDANVVKETEKDRLIIERSAEAYRSGNDVEQLDIDGIFEKTKEVDKAFVEKVSTPVISIKVRYDDIAHIRKERISSISKAVYGLLRVWKNSAPFDHAVREAYSAKTFKGLIIRILHLYNLETRMIGRSIKFFPPFSRAIGKFTDALFDAMESVGRSGRRLHKKYIRRRESIMPRPDLILLHPPSIFNFRERPTFYGPVSDVVPSTSIFEIYPIGFLTISDYLCRNGLSVRIVNLAMKMFRNRAFDPERFIKKLDASAFGIDLHWLPHVDGSLRLAELIKKHHPDTPVILGGLSSTYYHEEIMRDHPCVDFVVRGDSTEEPLRLLVKAIQQGRGHETIPNLVWRDGMGKVRVNDLTYRPRDLDNLSYDYFHLLKMAVKYRDPSGYIPFNYWLTYPVTAVFQCRGCVRNCASCAGSMSAFKNICFRERPCFRAPERLAEDVKRITEYTGAPIMVIGDIFQAGEEYARKFLDHLKKHRVDNEITIEFFSPPPEDFIDAIASSIRNFNVEMSPESHDMKVREAFGKSYSNEELERTIGSLLRAGCKRVDLFFMIGLPYQDYESVMETVGYCEELIRNFNGRGRILPMISPLAPFIDPGSAIFENPERHGYKLFYKTLADHRRAMLMSSWKYTLNYETRWMTRDEIVKATYDSALKLIAVKAKYGIIGSERAGAVRKHINRAIALMEKIDRAGKVEESLHDETVSLNTLDSLCDKHELDWPIKGMRLRFWNVIRLLLKRS